MPRFGGAFLYVAVATPLTLRMARAPCPLDVRIAAGATRHKPHGVDHGLRSRRRRGNVVGHQPRNPGGVTTPHLPLKILRDHANPSPEGSKSRVPLPPGQTRR